MTKTKHVDALGRPIFIGDVVIHIPSKGGARYGINKQFVIKSNDKSVNTNCSNGIPSTSIVVITDQVVADGGGAWIDEESKKIEFDNSSPQVKKKTERVVFVRAKRERNKPEHDYFAVKVLGTSKGDARKAARDLFKTIGRSYVADSYLQKVRAWGNTPEHYSWKGYDSESHSLRTVKFDSNLLDQQLHFDQLPECARNAKA